MKTKVIALAGVKGSGKDSVAKIIQNHGNDNGLTVRTVAFADPIKKVVQHIFELDDTSNEQYDLFKREVVKYQLPGYFSHLVTGRHIVREIGMLMRGYDDQQYIRYVRSKIESEPESIWIVTDMRFENEYSFLKEEYNAAMIKVKRVVDSTDKHITEREFADYRVRHLIENYSTKENLVKETLEVFETIQKEW